MDKNNNINSQSQEQQLVVLGAREHNLKDIDVEIPRHSLAVVTGLSGSGKSSLAFDTIYAEGNRRYIETFSAYARGFLGNLERPDVDQIIGLSPVISIEQKTTVKNPRSTIGTTTEIYDFLRLLYARTATAYSKGGKAMVSHNEEQIFAMVCRDFNNQRIQIFAPIVRDRKGHYRELLESMRRKGYLYVRADGEMLELKPGLALARYQNHRVEVLIDKLALQENEESLSRLKEALRVALHLGKGVVMVQKYQSTEEPLFYSKRLMDAETGESFEEPAPHTFSFNSPQGACPKCKGIGEVPAPDMSKIIPDPSRTIRQGGLAPLGNFKPNMIFKQLEAITEHHGFTINDPIKEFPEELMDDIMNGVDYPLKHKVEATGKVERLFSYDGLIAYLRALADEEESSKIRKWANQFSTYKCCPSCGGKRLNKVALSFKIDGHDISEVCNWSLPKLLEWIKGVSDKIEKRKKVVAKEIIKEIVNRLEFLLEMGLDYLTLNRTTGSLSGGEMQRIRLATQLGSKLVNVLYILDEPSIGLHQRDNTRLIESLKRLRDQGNSLIVVEHDKDMMLAADYIVDMGPGAGRKGGKVIYSGTPKEMLKADTLTAQYLNGTKAIEVPTSRRKGKGSSLRLIGATGNNLKGDTLEIPLGKLVLVTGVSGSGKSTYINDTLYPALSKHFYRSLEEPLPYKTIEGIEEVDKVVQVDQSPIGKMPRSNPATYTGVFTDIRNLFVEMPESKIRAYKPGRFSFNVKGGRCETCKGNGYKKIEMNFLPDVYVPCETCKGRRYNRETLEVRYKGKSIADVLDMTVNMAVEFFDTQPNILRKIKALQDVGLGYIKLGQSSNTLSGGEAQRVKLATELMKRDTGKTVYFLDEPTTGLHFEDIRVLMNILQKLVDKGNTVVIIEHNLDVIKVADHIIEIGPEGGEKGGRIVFEGTPEEMIAQDKGYTTPFLRDELKQK
ncbi:excinuclease ABC A subunit [Porphyromonas sp. CAG:1061]|uniref:excinuclease ABC subunit UvrA n=1 Tax=Porphyromonas sp. CAG:1061 TaxID=1262916 RepID=UPI00033BE814|nr:excinuclease ABC subunit UvrA [Porphyromonas sp. CAG:1061]CCY11793.1 excinuclease ABC A subunit [Porphyromonas sp. CAG:1061]